MWAIAERISMQGTPLKYSKLWYHILDPGYLSTTWNITAIFFLFFTTLMDSETCSEALYALSDLNRKEKIYKKSPWTTSPYSQPHVMTHYLEVDIWIIFKRIIECVGHWAFCVCRPFYDFYVITVLIFVGEARERGRPGHSPVGALALRIRPGKEYLKLRKQSILRIE